MSFTARNDSNLSRPFDQTKQGDRGNSLHPAKIVVPPDSIENIHRTVDLGSERWGRTARENKLRGGILSGTERFPQGTRVSGRRGLAGEHRAHTFEATRV